MANVDGNTNIYIGTRTTIDFVTKGKAESSPRTGVSVVGANIIGNVYGGGNQANVTGDTNVVVGR